MIWRARMMNDNDLYRQAQRQGTPSCTKLNDFVQRGRAQSLFIKQEFTIKI